VEKDLRKTVRLVLSPFSLATFPVRRLRVLRSMEEKQDGQKIACHPPQLFHMIFAQLNPAVGTFLAGRS